MADRWAVTYRRSRADFRVHDRFLAGNGPMGIRGGKFRHHHYLRLNDANLRSDREQGLNVRAGSRRMRPRFTLAILRQRSAWSAVWLGVVVFWTIFWANMAFAQGSPGYPDGARDPELWYYCYSSSVNHAHLTTTNPWDTPMTCQMVQWDVAPGGGGVHESVLLSGGVVADDADNNAENAHLRAFVVPARGIKKFGYSCVAQNKVCRNNGGGSFSQSVSSQDGSSYDSNGTNWSVPGVSNPSTIGTCTTSTLDVVAQFESDVYDAWWSPDIVATWTSSSSSEGTFFRIDSATVDDSLTPSGTFQCQIKSWESWPAWLDDNDEWEPGPIDLVATPTPTPGPSSGITLSVTPLAPVSNTVNVVIGEPGTPVCTTIIPSGGISETVFGYEIDSGWADYDVCAQPTEFTLEFFGIDFTGYLLLGLAVMSLGVVYRVFRTG